MTPATPETSLLRGVYIQPERDCHSRNPQWPFLKGPPLPRPVSKTGARPLMHMAARVIADNMDDIADAEHFNGISFKCLSRIYKELRARGGPSFRDWTLIAPHMAVYDNEQEQERRRRRKSRSSARDSESQAQAQAQAQTCNAWCRHYGIVFRVARSGQNPTQPQQRTGGGEGGGEGGGGGMLGMDWIQFCISPAHSLDVSFLVRLTLHLHGSSVIFPTQQVVALAKLKNLAILEIRLCGDDDDKRDGDWDRFDRIIRAWCEAAQNEHQPPDDAEPASFPSLKVMVLYELGTFSRSDLMSLSKLPKLALLDIGVPEATEPAKRDTDDSIILNAAREFGWDCRASYVGYIEYLPDIPEELLGGYYWPVDCAGQWPGLWQVGEAPWPVWAYARIEQLQREKKKRTKSEEKAESGDREKAELGGEEEEEPLPLLPSKPIAELLLEGDGCRCQPNTNTHYTFFRRLEAENGERHSDPSTTNSDKAEADHAEEEDGRQTKKGRRGLEGGGSGTASGSGTTNLQPPKKKLKKSKELLADLSY